MKAHKFNTIVSLIGVLTFWAWWILPVNKDIGLMGFLLLMYILTPASAIWGLAYSIYNKIWNWTAVFIIVGVLPWVGLRFGPEWLYQAIYKPLGSLFG